MTLLWAVIFFGLLIFFHELGHFIVAKLVDVKVLKFSLGFGPKIAGKKIGETEYLISAFPLGGYVKPLGEEPGEELEEEDRARAFFAQPVWKRVSIVLAGPVFNLVLAYIIFVSFLGLNLPVAIPELDSITTTIEGVMEGSPADEAGLKKEDTIVAIDGREVRDWSEMAEIFSENPGNELTVTAKRGEEEITVSVTPEPTKVEDESGQEKTIGRIGISKKLAADVIESSSIWQAPIRAWRRYISGAPLRLRWLSCSFPERCPPSRWEDRS